MGICVKNYMSDFYWTELVKSNNLIAYNVFLKSVFEILHNVWSKVDGIMITYFDEDKNYRIRRIFSNWILLYYCFIFY